MIVLYFPEGKLILVQPIIKFRLKLSNAQGQLFICNKKRREDKKESRKKWDSIDWPIDRPTDHTFHTCCARATNTICLSFDLMALHFQIFLLVLFPRNREPLILLRSPRPYWSRSVTFMSSYNRFFRHKEGYFRSIYFLSSLFCEMQHRRKLTKHVSWSVTYTRTAHKSVLEMDQFYTIYDLLSPSSSLLMSMLRKT